jgi:ribonuclease HI
MIQLYTDGGARGNPGPAAYAFLIFRDGKTVCEEAKKLGTTTNNVAEYTAVLEGLRRARKYGDSVEVFSDSELVVRQLNGEYKTKKPHLKELHYKIKGVESGFKEVRYSNNPREHPVQKAADELVNKALDS